MKLTLDMGSNANVITSYAKGQVVVNAQILTHSLVVTPERLITSWPPQSFAELENAHFAALTQLPVDIVLLGAGATLRFPAQGLLQPLTDQGIGVEVMDTGAACRTYNVLMAEGRRVAAALLMI